VHALEAAGALTPGIVSRWQWLRLTAVVRAEAGRIVVVVTGGEMQAVPLVRLPGNTGGDYALFLCGCGKRRRHLYLKAGRWTCRRCGHLDYAIRHICTTPHALLRARRLRERLGATSLQPFTPLPPRPRQHSAALKYDKLAAEIARCEAAALGALSALNVAVEVRKKSHDRQQQRSRSDKAG
jgi:hypothetical protein